MFRYVGLHCSNPDCKAFIVWKELKVGEPTPAVRALDIISGNCPKCKKAFLKTAGEMVEIETNDRPLNDSSQNLPTQILETTSQ
jgi:hypothetical protein